jgi:DNA-binding helix-hairpin-helix protein with protein kinase domain
VYFVDLGTTFATTSSGFVLTQVWGLIQSVPAPPPVSVANPSSFSVKAHPLPSSIPGEGTIAFYKFLAVAIAIIIFVAAPGAWFLALIVGWGAWAIASNSGSTERTAEKEKRRSALDLARKEYDRLVERARKEAGPEGFHARKAELTKLKAELEGIPHAEKGEIDRLHSTAHDRQKRRFLEACFLDKANISGVGPARKAALRSFGIETAADVTKNQVMQVRGFGESLTRAVLDWKASCERRFRYNPAAAVTETDRNVVRAKYIANRVTIERTLSSAPAQLQEFRRKAEAQLASLRPEIEVAARKLAQAQADYSLLG